MEVESSSTTIKLGVCGYVVRVVTNSHTGLHLFTSF